MKKKTANDNDENISDIINNNPVQVIFLVFAIATVIWMVPFFLACYNFVRYNMEHKPDNYEFPQFKDFWIAGASSIIFYTI